MVEGALETYGYEVDPTDQEDLHDLPQDAQRRRVRRLPAAGSRRPAGRSIITGLPDAYGRGRIIGDYRRVALYGVDALIAAKKRRSRRSWTCTLSSESVIRDREENAEQIRALGELKEMAASYGYDISGPAATAREAVQWLYFAYLAAVKEQNGAAMSLGRTSTFLDVYLQRDLDAGLLTEQQAQELVDDFVIKLRIVRFLRTPEYDALFSGDPTWVTESIGGMGDDGRTAGHPHLVPVPADPLQPRAGPGAEPDGVVERRAARAASSSFCAQVSIDTIGDPVRVRRADAPPVRRRHRHRLLRVGDARRQADAVLRRPGQPRQDAALRDQRRPRRDHRRAGRPRRRRRSTGDVLDYDDVRRRLRPRCWTGWPRPTSTRSTSSTTCTTSTPTSGWRWRCTTAPSCARWPAASPGCRSPPTACRRSGTHRSSRCATRRGLVVDYVTEGDVPDLRQRRRPGRRHRRRAGPERFMAQAAPAPDLPRRGAHPVGADHHLERRLRQGHRQHAGRPPRRASRSRPAPTR